MNKKSKSKQESNILQVLAQEENKVNEESREFYIDGTIATFIPSSSQAPLASLLTQTKQSSAPQAPTQEQLSEKCQQIRDNVSQGKTGNIEIQFYKGRQLSGIKAGDKLDASVFLGGDNAFGIMVIKDESGDEYFLRISEFHLLSLRENPDPNKEVGLMTSFLWLTAKVYTSIVFASNLFPVKNLLLSEWLQKEWQRAKGSALKLSSEEVGGESNG